MVQLNHHWVPFGTFFLTLWSFYLGPSGLSRPIARKARAGQTVGTRHALKAATPSLGTRHALRAATPSLSPSASAREWWGGSQTLQRVRPQCSLKFDPPRKPRLTLRCHAFLYSVKHTKVYIACRLCKHLRVKMVQLNHHWVPFGTFFLTLWSFYLGPSGLSRPIARKARAGQTVGTRHALKAATPSLGTRHALRAATPSTIPNMPQ